MCPTNHDRKFFLINLHLQSIAYTYSNSILSFCKAWSISSASPSIIFWKPKSLLNSTTNQAVTAGSEIRGFVEHIDANTFTYKEICFCKKDIITCPLYEHLICPRTMNLSDFLPQLVKNSCMNCHLFLVQLFPFQNDKHSWPQISYSWHQSTPFGLVAYWDI